MSVVLSCLGQEFHRAVLSVKYSARLSSMFVRNTWEIYTSFPPNKDGKMVHFGFCAVSFMICEGGGGGFAVSFFMILSKIVAPWGLPII